MTAILVVVAAASLASAVEAVEALTIVLAVGLTHGWRTALMGVALALVALALVVLAMGPALVRVVPIGSLQLLIGVLLLIFGLQWLRKAIQRASGLRALHDEDAIFAAEVADLTRAGVDANKSDFDWTGFVVAFKGVFLEGLEVVFIVLTISAGHEDAFGWSVAGAIVSFLVVTAIGIALHRPLARVPENTIKFSVGLMLAGFGTFWAGEGIGVEWTMGDVAILALTAFYAAVSFVLVTMLRRRNQVSRRTEAPA